MSGPTSLLTLPPELRTIVYDYVKLFHTSRHIRLTQNTFKVTTPGLVGTCRLIRNEYDDTLNGVKKLCFTVEALNFTHVARFVRKLNERDLTILRRSGAVVEVRLTCTGEYERDIEKLCRWLRWCDREILPFTYRAYRVDFTVHMSGLTDFVETAQDGCANSTVKAMYDALDAAEVTHRYGWKGKVWIGRGRMLWRGQKSWLGM